MKKIYFIALFALMCNFAMAQIESTTYRGAFAPSPTPMWTDSWTSWDPQNEAYADKAAAETDVAPANSNIVNVTTDITTNTTWYATKTYKLSGIIYVRNNATLTIQAGTLIKGIYTTAGTALVITKGAKINAIGTATAPIIFTSSKAPTLRAAGDWGGIAILGKAGFNTNAGINNIEGITATLNTEYGGGTSPINNDNSGTLKYVRIEYAGFVFSPNNELNGLTFGGVGNGTTVDYVQVSHSNDDSFEWFGGSVNCKHLVAFKGLDDDFDTDNGYKGFVQFALGIRDPNVADNPAVSNSEGFESDNNANTAEALTGYDNTSAIFTNITLLGPSKRSASIAAGYSRALRLRRTTELKIYNSIFLDFKNNYVGLTDDQTVSKYYSGKLKLKNNLFAGMLQSDLTSYAGGVNPASVTGNSVTAAYTSGGSVFGVPNGTVFNLTSKMIADNNITQLSSDNVLESPYNTANYSSYSGMDYRPKASDGASFTDSNLAALLSTPVAVDGSTPAVSNSAIAYCKGAVATPLTATLSTTGVALKWWKATTATGTKTLLTAAPTPTTSTAGIQYYWVSQTTATVESEKVAITVTVNALPSEVISVITGVGPVTSASGVTPAVYASATAVGPYIGTTTQFTYSVTAFVDTSLSYVWTVPSGVNIISGQGTRTLTVNYANIAPGSATAVGTINVQAKNTSDCLTAAKTLSITKALPAAPASLLMYNKNLGYATPTVAFTSYAKYMGSTTPITLTAAVVAAASSYEWQLPAGVAIAAGTAGTSYDRFFTAEPFTAPLTSYTAPAAGTKYWKVTYSPTTQDVNGVSTVVTSSTASQIIAGADYTYTFTLVNTSSIAKDVIFTYGGNSFKVSTALNNGKSLVCKSVPATANYASVAISASVNGNLVLSTDSSVTHAFSKIVKAGYTASSQAYAPYGTVISSDKNSILVNFNGVTANTATAMYIGVKSKNGVGVSSTSNATNVDVVASASNQATAIPGLYNRTYTETFTAPNSTTLANAISLIEANGYATTTAKIVKITAALPTAPTTLVMTNPNGASTTAAVTVISSFFGKTTPFTLTAGAVATASSYEWELPYGVVRTDAQGTNSTSNTITVNFSAYTAETAAGLTSLYVGVKAKNNIGVSSTNNSAATVIPATNSQAKLLKLTAALPAVVATVTGQIALVNCGVSYPYTITAPLGATSYLITAPAGSVVTSANGVSGATANIMTTSDLTFSVVYPAIVTTDNKLTVKSINLVGSCATFKSLTLTKGAACPTGGIVSNTTIDETSRVNVTEMYPNPTSSSFNVELSSAKANDVSVTVYSFDGMVVSSKNVQLSEGNNVINENLSSQRNGIYVVRIVNSSTGEVIIKKIVKQ